MIRTIQKRGIQLEIADEPTLYNLNVEWCGTQPMMRVMSHRDTWTLGAKPKRKDSESGDKLEEVRSWKLCIPLTVDVGEEFWLSRSRTPAA